MRPSDIERIEQSLGLIVPLPYRAVMTGPERPWDDGCWRGGLFDRADLVITRTTQLRDELRSWGRSVKNTWLVVTEVDGGDTVFLDCDDPRGSLMFLNHETFVIAPYDDTVVTFAAGVDELSRKSLGAE